MDWPHGWNHVICVKCWNRSNPDRLVNENSTPGALARCCFCGNENRGGIIYVREDPNAPELKCRNYAAFAHPPIEQTSAPAPAEDEDSSPAVALGIAAAEVISEIVSDPDPAPDPPADTFDGFGGGDTGGGGAGGDW